MLFRRLREHRGLLAMLLAVGCLIALGLVVFSPLALAGLNQSGRNWPQLSNIGQTYGAISALISSLALGGVVVSLFYQSRELRVARNNSLRDFRHQLIRMEMEDPALMNAMGAPWNLSIPPESEHIRNYLYVQMWVSFNAGNYAIGEVSDAGVTHMARDELFRGTAGRLYWSAIRENVLNAGKKEHQRFARLIDAEYQKVLADDRPVNEPIRITGNNDPVEPPWRDQVLRALPIAAGIMVGIVAGRRINHGSSKTNSTNPAGR